MRVRHKSVTHPFFCYTKISEFFDMQNLGEDFRELSSNNSMIENIYTFPKNWRAVYLCKCQGY